MRVTEIRQQKTSDICATKYPILLAHGVASRDTRPIGAWGRIPKALEEHGAAVYFGGQDSWGTIENNAEILARRILSIVRETGCDKVNIIAHSKGGLDSRCAVASFGMDDHVASLTTICTPHHGVKTMDTLSKLPLPLFKITGFIVDAVGRTFGDVEPDFTTTCQQWTTSNMSRFNENNPDSPKVYYQSFAAVMSSPFSDILMSVPNLFTRGIDGANDGIVPVTSAEWGIYRGELRGDRRRGVSHVDVVDLRRRNVSGRYDGLSDSGEFSDTRVVYVNIAAELKLMGF